MLIYKPEMTPDRHSYRERLTMIGDTVSKVALIFGILYVVLAVIVFVFADGLRRYYRGRLIEART